MKKTARRKWQQIREPVAQNNLSNKTEQLKSKIQKVKETSINRYLRNLTSDGRTDYSLWKATRKLKRPTAHTPPLRKPDGNWARDNKQKADAFANHLENTFKPKFYAHY